jgi:hypothetical protein
MMKKDSKGCYLVAAHLLERLRAPQLPVNEVKDIYSSIGPGKVNKTQDTTTIAAVRLSIGYWLLDGSLCSRDR